MTRSLKIEYKKCLQCGISFQVKSRNKQRKKEQRFCSTSCCNKFHGKLKVKLPKFKKCLECGNEFQYRLERTLFCSLKCSQARNGRNMRKPNKLPFAQAAINSILFLYERRDEWIWDIGTKSIGAIKMKKYVDVKFEKGKYYWKINSDGIKLVEEKLSAYNES